MLFERSGGPTLARLCRQCGHLAEHRGHRLEHRLARARSRRNARVDGRLEGEEVGRDARLQNRDGHHTARQVRLYLELARGPVEQDGDVGRLDLEPVPHRGEPHDTAQRHDVGGGDDQRQVGHLDGYRACLAQRAARIDDRQVLARADRGEDVACRCRGHALGLLAVLGSQQHAHAAGMCVHRFLQVARGELVGHPCQVGHAAPIWQVEKRAEVAALEVVLDERYRRRAELSRREREVHRDGRRADSALCSDDGDDPPNAEQISALAFRSPPQRLGPRRRGEHARLELLERDRSGEHVPGAGLHAAAQNLRRVLGDDQDEPDIRVRDGQLARDLDQRQRSAAIVEDDRIDIGARKGTPQLLGIAQPRHRLELVALCHQARDVIGDPVVVDREQRANHRPGW